MRRARARSRRPDHDVSTAWLSLPFEITRGMLFSPQRLAELSARDDEHSKIGGARGAQFGGDGVDRGELAGRAIRAGQHARGEVGLEDIEVVDQGLDRGLLPGRLCRQMARGIAQLVESKTGADPV